MRIRPSVFVSYPRELRHDVELIVHQLKESGFSVFFDRESLRDGFEYRRRIRSEISRASFALIVISDAAFERGRFLLTELDLIRRKWPNPSGRVLAVALTPYSRITVPPYLRIGTILEVKGDPAVDVSVAVEEMIRFDRNRKQLSALIFSALLSIFLMGSMYYYFSSVGEYKNAVRLVIRTEASSAAGSTIYLAEVDSTSFDRNDQSIWLVAQDASGAHYHQRNRPQLGALSKVAVPVSNASSYPLVFFVASVARAREREVIQMFDQSPPLFGLMQSSEVVSNSCIIFSPESPYIDCDRD